jgi:hypothetical protein
MMDSDRGQHVGWADGRMRRTRRPKDAPCREGMASLELHTNTLVGLHAVCVCAGRILGMACAAAAAHLTGLLYSHAWQSVRVAP